MMHGDYIKPEKVLLRISFLIILIICPTITGNIITAQHKSYLISNATTVVDGAAAPFNQLKPGDTLLIQAGIRNSLTIRNIK